MRWSEKEINILKKAYPDQGLKTVKKLLPDRTENAILLKASMLGIRLRKNYCRKMWTEDEIEKIGEHYPTKPRKELIQYFPDRTIDQIKQKARKLGIRREVGLSFKGFKNLDIPEIEKAYIAGIFDGEDHVILHKNNKKNCSYYTPEVGIANTDMNLMRYLINTLKCGGINANLHIQKKGKNKPVGVTHITTHIDAHCLLKALLPYLKVKRDRAKILVEFIEKKAKKVDTSSCLKKLGYDKLT